MNYTLRDIDGKAEYIMRTGKDFVASSMPISMARRIISSGTVCESPNPEYPLGINDNYFFKADEVAEKKTRGAKRK